MTNNKYADDDCECFSIPGGEGFASSEGCEGSVFRAAFRSSRAIMYLIDPTSAKLMEANPAACDFYGYSHEEVSHLPLTEVSLMSLAEIKDMLAGILRSGPIQFATRHRIKNGELRDMELDATPIVLHNGRPCIFFVGHDITARIHAERTLRERESLLHAILDSAGAGIGFKDTNNIYREANPAFCSTLGFPCEHILGHSSSEFFDISVNSQHAYADEDVLEKRTQVVYEVTFPSKDGPRILSIHKAPVIDTEDKCLGVVFISHDITQQRNAEKALRQSEGLLRAVIHSAQDSISVIAPDETFCEANQSLCDILGVTRKELIGAPLSSIFTSEALHIQRSSNTLAKEAGQPVHFEQRYMLQARPAANGSPARPAREAWFSVIKTAVHDDEGNFMGVLGMGREVTAQKQTEQDLRQSERRFASLVRQSPVGVFETDEYGKLIYANERMQRQTGKSLEALMGDGWISSIHPDDLPAFRQHWETAAHSGKELSTEVRLRVGHGSVLWVLCNMRPLHEAQGGLTGYMGTLVDITERRQAEILREDVENVVRHDLKSPLGSMQSAAELLGMLGPLNDEQEQVLREMRVTVKRMIGLIMLSLDLASMESGVYVPALQSHDLREVLTAMEAEIRGLLKAKGVEISISPGAEAGPFPVLGERRLLDSVFSNLLKNAAEAAPENSSIEIRLWEDTRQGSSLAMASVRNAGEVPEAIRRRFFEKFTTSGKKGGTGLGTYSARLMLRTMGGTLALDTTEPGFTTLTIRLPRPSLAHLHLTDS